MTTRLYKAATRRVGLSDGLAVLLALALVAANLFLFFWKG